MIYKVKIVEHLEKEVEVDAVDSLQAEDIVRRAYLNDEYEFFSGHVHVDAIAVKEENGFTPIL